MSDLGPDTGDRKLAEDLRGRMDDAGLTPSQVAHHIGVHVSMIKKYLCDHQRPQLPSRETWLKLEALFPLLYKPSSFNVEERGKTEAGRPAQQPTKPDAFKAWKERKPPVDETVAYFDRLRAERAKGAA